ncbi:ATP-binding protein [Streptomyces sp. NPDC012461]|jgi:hypothetical protein|uniref:ATP-binding protein n=2 Tax=unclassified Streptomyces TaxID=2593676 RepID=A0A6G3R413_9ACTN|nr:MULTISPECIES: ATP-binding protein [unclassified Streptomyces]MBM7089115.1 ATP-binding protein [Streptomyces sp. S12]NEA90177.1 ATP-binding protein [Streptomyces sp. SID14436]NEC27909.1 ATP-binding protein [Streptomyces sp. SID8111]
MKQSAAKTLGVAALGAAFAATGAGAATAAPALPDAGSALDTVTQAVPAENVSGVLPGAERALETGQQVAGTGMTAAQPVAQQLLSEGPTQPVAGLLGGLPLAGLPTQGLPVNGLPLG